MRNYKYNIGDKVKVRSVRADILSREIDFELIKGNIFKGPFHIPRFYMIMATMDETQDIIKFMK